LAQPRTREDESCGKLKNENLPALAVESVNVYILLHVDAFGEFMVPDEVISKVKAALKIVYDPEIPVNVVDLGLIRDMRMEDNSLVIKMVMTAPGCPYETYIAEMVRDAVRAAVPELKDVRVEMEQFPPWTPYEMTEEGRKEFKEKAGYDIMDAFIQRWGSKENYYDMVKKYLGID